IPACRCLWLRTSEAPHELLCRRPIALQHIPSVFATDHARSACAAAPLHEFSDPEAIVSAFSMSPKRIAPRRRKGGIFVAIEGTGPGNYGRAFQRLRMPEQWRWSRLSFA